MDILSVLLIPITVFFVIEYWAERQEAGRYKQLYDDMWKWLLETPQNKEEEITDEE